MVFLVTSGCASNNNSYYGELTTNPTNAQSNSLIELGAQLFRNSAYSVPRKDRDQHEQCVFFTLDNLFLGERCDWYSQNGSTRGQVAVVAYRPQGSGYCATLFNAVYHKGEWANWQDVACRTGATSSWRFVSQ